MCSFQMVSNDLRLCDEGKFYSLLLLHRTKSHVNGKTNAELKQYTYLHVKYAEDSSPYSPLILGEMTDLQD